MDKSVLIEASEYWNNHDERSIKMERAEIKQEIEKYITSHNTCGLATGFGNFVRCTPVEYSYKDKAFWIFSEGGLKFKALCENDNVCLAIFDAYKGFDTLAGMQVIGKAEVVEMWSDEYLNMLIFKNIPPQALKNMKSNLFLIKILPTRINYLCSSFKKRGFDTRQFIELDE